MSDPTAELINLLSQIQLLLNRRTKRIYTRTEAADYLGMSLSAFDEARKNTPFFQADAGSQKQGGSALWSIQRLDLMADVRLGWLSIEDAESYMRKYRNVRYEDIIELCLSEADKYRREARRRKAAKRQRTIDAKREAVEA